MQIFVEDIYLNIWEAIKIGPFIPTMVVGNATIKKPREELDDDERRRVQYNLNAKNIITFALCMDEYFSVSDCKNAKKMWDTLQVTHEGTTDVKRSKSKI